LFKANFPGHYPILGTQKDLEGAGPECPRVYGPALRPAESVLNTSKKWNN